MPYQIDQSIKIEATSKDTVLGLANHHSYTVIIPGKTKLKLQSEFRLLNKPRLFIYRTFIAGVVLLIKYARVDQNHEVLVDNEYLYLEPLLLNIYQELTQHPSRSYPPITFHSIGKKSPAHRICYLTMSGKIPPNRILTYQELKKLTLKEKTRVLKRRMITAVRHPRV